VRPIRLPRKFLWLAGRNKTASVGLLTEAFFIIGTGTVIFVDQNG